MADLSPEEICRLIVEAPSPTVAAFRIWEAINGDGRTPPLRRYDSRAARPSLSEVREARKG